MYELKQQITQRQELKMTIQLQQAIKLLQLSRLELDQEIGQELERNPALELVEQEADAREGGAEASVEDKRAEERKDDAERREAERVTQILDRYHEMRPYDGPPIRARDEELPSFEARASTPESLMDHLVWQLRVGDFSFEEQLVGMELVGNIDDDGYLRQEGIDAVTLATGASPELVESVLRRVQLFDPLGVGARNLQECLLIQARTLFPMEPVLHTLIELHLSELAGRASLTLAKRLGISKEDFERLYGMIARLDPKPGKSVNTTPADYIIPDVVVSRTSEGIVVELNENGLSKIRVSPSFRRLLAESVRQKKETINYIKEHIRSAEWMVRSIYQRQATIKKVAEAIFRFQGDFLDFGDAYLKPLVLRDIAEEVEMHESTISRVTSNKYAQTPHGVFELKHFFGSRIEASGGEDLAGQAIRMRIRKLIQAEDPRQPLSDQAIVEKLAADGIKIARRTVAKYRQLLGFLSSSERTKAM